VMKAERAKEIYLQFARRSLGQINKIDATDEELEEFVDIGRAHSELLARDVVVELARRKVL